MCNEMSSQIKIIITIIIITIIIIIIVIIIVIIIIIITMGMIRTYIEEALAGELLATDCAENLVRLPTNLKINFFCDFIHRYSTFGFF